MKIFIALNFVCCVVTILARLNNEEFPNNSDVSSNKSDGILPSLNEFFGHALEIINNIFATPVHPDNMEHSIDERSVNGEIRNSPVIVP
ncbi:hypothetical protein PGB90_002390 [Kerria lacca]